MQNNPVVTPECECGCITFMVTANQKLYCNACKKPHLAMTQASPPPDENGWITLECERAHYVTEGREVVLCDRLPSPVTLVVKLAALQSIGPLMRERDADREEIAQAIHGKPDYWKCTNLDEKEMYRSQADRVIAALNGIEGQG